EQHLVGEEGACGGDPARDRRRRQAFRAQLGEVRPQVVRARRGERLAEASGEMREVAPVGFHGARRPPGREQGEEALELWITHLMPLSRLQADCLPSYATGRSRPVSTS